MVTGLPRQIWWLHKTIIRRQLFLLDNGIIDDFIIRFELYNIANQSRYPNATYHVSIVKNEYAPNEKDRSILDGTFITRNGFLTLYINN
jgi:hypothetical protein